MLKIAQITNMFAIVEYKGEQIKIDGTTSQIRVPYLGDHKIGAHIQFDKMLLSQGSNGAVALGGSLKITATVAGHGRDAKIIVFKKHRRKRYRVTNGHRQNYTLLDVSFA